MRFVVRMVGATRFTCQVQCNSELYLVTLAFRCKQSRNDDYPP